ncbi:putative PIN family toxin of toxin-antitoxin system [Anaerobacterium chartisolvens]|uniref:Putative PIN family toxin of toxin-antitoxin system n=1 Tax=Anaerobacterium chartisolvens TaxID=1297424 RepID=A0A369AMR6_9FIRM|nr:putative toxin-antitoxin system toxin component, PIN family [Anaerobacterium chartisolvens]RCX10355.1 putative PIN family toxin of toxin-antitoxin system [Anaerobacterium chartisolvens]
MIKAAIDTNILVSALLSPSGSPAKVIDCVLNGNVIMCYDSRIIAEYQEVLVRPKFGFEKKLVRQLIDFILHSGISVVPIPILDAFEDEDDKMFYEVAKTAKAYVVTGNEKHFPSDPIVITPQKFLSVVI